MNSLQKIKQFLYYARVPFLILIWFYQRLFSPDHSFWAKHFYPKGFCRFTPSCSEYGRQSIKKYGVFKGGAKSLWRILRCNPWNEGGEDLP